MKKIFTFILLLLPVLMLQAQVITYAPMINTPQGSVVVPVTVDNFTDVGGISLKIVYDPTVLTYNGFTQPILTDLSVNNFLNISPSIPGILVIGRLGGSAAPTIPNGGVLVNLNFTKITDGTSLLTFLDDSQGSGCEYQKFSTGLKYTDTPFEDYYKNGWVTSLTLNLAKSDPYCSSTGTIPGSITSTVTKGNSPYTYLWTGPGITPANETDPSPTGLSVGTYTVTVTDALGAWITQSIDLSIANYWVKNLTTNEEFCSIQAAIDAPNTLPGHSIAVDPQTFNEHVVINKANLTLVSSDPLQKPVINGGGTGVVVTITANNVVFEGFEVTGSGSNPAANAGILLQGVTGCSVKNNDVANNSSIGIALVLSNGNLIEGNTLDDNTYAGIALAGSSNNSLIDNDVLNTQILGVDAWGIVVNGIDTDNDTKDDVFSTGNTLSGNTVSGNLVGVYFGWECNENNLDDNTITGNTADGFTAWKSHDHDITNNIITGNGGPGIQLHASQDNDITGNTITGNNTANDPAQGGILIRSGHVEYQYPTPLLSTGNTINENTIAGNSGYGVVYENNTAYTDDDNLVIDATANWWGYATGPYHATKNTCGQGNAISNNVDVCLWYTDAGMDPSDLEGCYILFFEVTGGGVYCKGHDGLLVALNGSEADIEYQLYLNGDATGMPMVVGTGSAISFGLQTLAGTYTVKATNTITGCADIVMTGNAVITIDEVLFDYLATLTYTETVDFDGLCFPSSLPINQISGTGGIVAIFDAIDNLPTGLWVHSIAGVTLTGNQAADGLAIKNALIALMEAQSPDNTIGGLDAQSILIDVVFGNQNICVEQKTFTVTFDTSIPDAQQAMLDYIDGIPTTSTETFNYAPACIASGDLISSISGTGTMAALIAGLPTTVDVVSIAGYTMTGVPATDMAGIKAALTLLMQTHGTTVGDLSGKSITFNVVYANKLNAACTQTVAYTINFNTAIPAAQQAMLDYIDGIPTTATETFAYAPACIASDDLISSISGTGTMADLIANLPTTTTVVSIAGFALTVDPAVNMAGIKAALVALMEAQTANNTVGELDGKSITYDVVYANLLNSACQVTVTYTITFDTDIPDAQQALEDFVAAQNLANTSTETFNYAVCIASGDAINSISGTNTMVDLAAQMAALQAGGQISVVSIAGVTNLTMANIKAAIISLMEAQTTSNTVGELDGKSISIPVVYSNTLNPGCQATVTYTITFDTDIPDAQQALEDFVAAQNLANTSTETFNYAVCIASGDAINSISGTNTMVDLAAQMAALQAGGQISVVSIAGVTNLTMANIKAAIISLMEAQTTSNTVGELDGKSISIPVVYSNTLNPGCQATVTYTITFDTDIPDAQQALEDFVAAQNLANTSTETFNYAVCIASGDAINSISGTNTMVDLAAQMAALQAGGQISVVSIAGVTNLTMANIKAAIISLMEAQTTSNTVGELDGKSISIPVVYSNTLNPGCQATVTYTITFDTDIPDAQQALEDFVAAQNLANTSTETFNYAVCIASGDAINSISGTNTMVDLAAQMAALQAGGQISVVSIAGVTNLTMANIKAAIISLMEAQTTSNTVGELDGKSISIPVVYSNTLNPGCQATVTYTITFDTDIPDAQQALEDFVAAQNLANTSTETFNYAVCIASGDAINSISGTNTMVDLAAQMAALQAGGQISVVSIAGVTNLTMANIKAAIISLMEAQTTSNTVGELDGKSISIPVVYSNTLNPGCQATVTYTITFDTDIPDAQQALEDFVAAQNLANTSTETFNYAVCIASGDAINSISGTNTMVDLAAQMAALQAGGQISVVSIAGVTNLTMANIKAAIISLMEAQTTSNTVGELDGKSISIPVVYSNTLNPGCQATVTYTITFDTDIPDAQQALEDFVAAQNLANTSTETFNYAVCIASGDAINSISGTNTMVDLAAQMAALQAGGQISVVSIAGVTNLTMANIKAAIISLMEAQTTSNTVGELDGKSISIPVVYSNTLNPGCQATVTYTITFDTDIPDAQQALEDFVAAQNLANTSTETFNYAVCIASGDAINSISGTNTMVDLAAQMAALQAGGQISVVSIAGVTNLTMANIKAAIISLMEAQTTSNTVGELDGKSISIPVVYSNTLNPGCQATVTYTITFDTDIPDAQQALEDFVAAQNLANTSTETFNYAVCIASGDAINSISGTNTMVDLAAQMAALQAGGQISVVSIAGVTNLTMANIKAAIISLMEAQTTSNTVGELDGKSISIPVVYSNTLNPGCQATVTYTITFDTDIPDAQQALEDFVAAQNLANTSTETFNYAVCIASGDAINSISGTNTMVDLAAQMAALQAGGQISVVSIAGVTNLTMANIKAAIISLMEAQTTSNTVGELDGKSISIPVVYSNTLNPGCQATVTYTITFDTDIPDAQQALEDFVAAQNLANTSTETFNYAVCIASGDAINSISGTNTMVDLAAQMAALQAGGQISVVSIAGVTNLTMANIKAAIISLMEAQTTSNTVGELDGKSISIPVVYSNTLNPGCQATVTYTITFDTDIPDAQQALEDFVAAQNLANTSTETFNYAVCIASGDAINSISGTNTMVDLAAQMAALQAGGQISVVSIAGVTNLTMANIKAAIISLMEAQTTSNTVGELDGKSISIPVVYSNTLNPGCQATVTYTITFDTDIPDAQQALEDFVAAQNLANTSTETFNYAVCIASGDAINSISGTNTMVDLAAQMAALQAGGQISVVSIAGVTNLTMANIKAAIISLMEAQTTSNTVGELDGKSISIPVVYSNTLNPGCQATVTYTITFDTDIPDAQQALEDFVAAQNLANTSTETFNYAVCIASGDAINSISGTNTMVDLAAQMAALQAGGQISVVSIAGVTNLTMANIKAAIISLMEAQTTSNTVGELDGKSISIPVVYSNTLNPGCQATVTYTITFDTDIPDAQQILEDYTDALTLTGTMDFEGFCLTGNTPINSISGTGLIVDLFAQIATIPTEVNVISIAGYTMTGNPLVDMPGVKAAIVTLMLVEGTTVGDLDGKSIGIVVVYANALNTSCTVTKTFTITFDSTIPNGNPLTVTCPADINASVDAGACGATVNFAATASAGEPTPITITYKIGTTTITSPHFFDVGTTAVDVTAENICGTVTCSFDVIVTDDEDPVITCPGNITQTADAGFCSTTVTYTAPVGTDNCPGATTTQIAGLPSGATYPVGVTTNTFKVTDAYGNTAQCSFTVTVTDDEKPLITLLGSPSVQQCLGTTYTDAGATAADNCDGDLTGSIVKLIPVNMSIAGTYTITYDVSDAASNAAIQVTRTVTVVDCSVSGTYTYNNAGTKALDSVKVELWQGGAKVYGPVTTSTGGAYTLSGVLPGTYEVRASSSKVVGSINATDAGLVNQFQTMVSPSNPIPMEKVKYLAGDVGVNAFVLTSFDAQQILTYYNTSGASGWTLNPGVMWAFWKKDDIISQNNWTDGPWPTVTITNDAVVQNFLGQARGDFNASFNPAPFAKSGGAGITLTETR
jgi:parallel beta-helix repeat protein